MSLNSYSVYQNAQVIQFIKPPLSYSKIVLLIIMSLFSLLTLASSSEVKTQFTRDTTVVDLKSPCIPTQILKLI